MGREFTTFVRALAGPAVIGAAILLAVYGVAANNAGLLPLLLPFLPAVVFGLVFFGSRIIRAAYRDATRPR